MIETGIAGALHVAFGSPAGERDQAQLGTAPRAQLARHVVAAAPRHADIEHRNVRLGRHDLLVAMSRQMESFAEGLGREGLLVAAFQTSPRFTEATRVQYSELAGRLGFVAALAEGLEEDPAPGVFGGSLDPGDPMVREWTVAVVGPFIAAALVANEVEPDGDERRFEFQVTYDRREVVDVARVMLERLA